LHLHDAEAGGAVAGEAYKTSRSPPPSFAPIAEEIPVLSIPSSRIEW
jgi:hypothetical protein